MLSETPPQATLALHWLDGRIATRETPRCGFPGAFGGPLKDRAAQPVGRWGLMAVCALSARGISSAGPLLALLLSLAVASPAFAQAQAPGPTPAPKAEKSQRSKSLKSEVDMTLVNVSVTDPYGRLVTGLEQGNFRVFEDSVEQEIVRFSSEDVPISIGVIFDMSGSMSDKIDKSRLAAVHGWHHGSAGRPRGSSCAVGP